MPALEVPFWGPNLGTFSACGHIERPKLALPVLVRKSETTFIIQTFPKNEDQDHWFHFQSVFIIITLFIIFTSEQKCRPNSLPSFTFTLVTWQQSVFINPQINIITKKNLKKSTPSKEQRTQQRWSDHQPAVPASRSRAKFSRKKSSSAPASSRPSSSRSSCKRCFLEKSLQKRKWTLFCKKLRTDLPQKHPFF